MARPEIQDRELSEQYDVLIVGAGISGIGAAYHLQKQCPQKSFAIVDEQADFGGTWRTHNYPGLRSDSDLYTFGYRFKPWTGNPIANGEEILDYVGDVIVDNNLEPTIRYNRRVVAADWSSDQKCWLVSLSNMVTGETKQVSANFLWMCQGYYDHAGGYIPEWEGMDEYRGEIVHPQTWPEDLVYKGKKVVLIGSGATAATVVPAIAKECAHVTLLQRSPTYFVSGENKNELADTLRELEIDESWVHEIVRRNNLLEHYKFTQGAAEHPDIAKKELLDGVRAHLGPDYDVDTHFTPNYRPWQQRVAFVPDGDLFQGIKNGDVTMVTDHIDRFTETGIQLQSGEHLEADLVISATGFNLSVLGGIPFSCDGRQVNWADAITYRGTMFTGVPNMLWVFGYFRSSWTLRVDLLADFVCRMLNHMDEAGVSSVEVGLREEDRDMEIFPWLDTEDLNPGYLKRKMHLMPKRGSKIEWQHTQDYWLEKDELPKLDLTSSIFRYR